MKQAELLTAEESNEFSTDMETRVHNLILRVMYGPVRIGLLHKVSTQPSPVRVSLQPSWRSGRNGRNGKMTPPHVPTRLDRERVSRSREKQKNTLPPQAATVPA